MSDWRDVKWHCSVYIDHTIVMDIVIGIWRVNLNIS